MKAITDIDADELEITVEFFQIGGYVSETEYDTMVATLEERIKALEDDLNTRVFG